MTLGLPLGFTQIIAFSPIFLAFFAPLTVSRLKPRFYGQYVFDLKYLAQFESQFAQNLTKAYLANGTFARGSQIRQLVKQYLLDFYEANGFATGQTELQFELNPICAYRLIRRVKHFLSDLTRRDSFRRNLGILWRQANFFFWKNGWPRVEDTKFTTEAILRLHHVYDFDLEQFASGKISATQATNCTLHSIHCYEIGNAAIKRKQFAPAIEWLELAKEMALKDHEASSPFAEFSLWNAIEKHNKNFDEELNIDMDPTFFNREIQHVPRDSKNAKKIRNIQIETYTGKRGRLYDDANYLNLCSGNNLQTEEEKSDLFCWYEFKTHESLAIGPAKMEFLAKNPDIVRIYEVVQENEIRSILAASHSTMIPAKAAGRELDKKSRRLKEDDILNKNVRSSVHSWEVGPAELALSKKIERITGLHVARPSSASEALQVASYSVGGHYGPHLDAHNRAKLNHDSRLATFMFYFNDVDEGGSTAFTSMGVTAKPVKGSAVFWYNLYSDGGVDWATMHGACPVVVGEKWAANKWIHLFDQLLIRKCDLTGNQRFQIPVNNKV